MITRLVFQYGSRAFVALADKFLEKYDLFEVREAAPLVLEHLKRQGTPFHRDKSRWLQKMVLELLPGFRPEAAKICQAQPEEIQRWLGDRAAFLGRAMRQDAVAVSQRELDEDAARVDRFLRRRRSFQLAGKPRRVDLRRAYPAPKTAPVPNKVGDASPVVATEGPSASFVNPSLDAYFEISPEERERADQQQRDLFAKWRDRILADETFYTAKELAEQRGAGQKYSAQNALNLRDSGKIFGIFVNGKYRYPKFQFSVLDSQPLEVVSAVIRQVPLESRQWPLLLWFWSPSTRLSGKTPRELIGDRMSESDKQRLLAAVEDAFSSPVP